jgi:hypothetical protein
VKKFKWLIYVLIASIHKHQLFIAFFVNLNEIITIKNKSLREYQVNEFEDKITHPWTN